jgi:hypothetical protein
MLALALAGFLFATAAVPGRGLAVRLALGFVLGQAAFLLQLNLLMRAGLEIGASSPLALLVVVLEAIGLRLAGVRRPRRPGVGIDELRLLGVATLPFLYALLWQLGQRDDDFFIHWPLIGLFRRGVFPPVNPFFPQLAYAGHYGRDLLAAGLSCFWPGDFHELLLWQTALAQGALLILVFAVFGRPLTAPSGAFAVALAFLGVNASIRLGLLDTFQNNNAMANVLFFAAFVLLADPPAVRRPGGRLCAFLVLTALALVYETHFVCLLGGVALALVPALVKRHRRFQALRIVAVLGLSAFVALGQGGTLTNWLERRVAGRHERSEDIVGLSQAVNVSFPKTSLSVTSRDGRELPLGSNGFRAEAGPWPIWLPIFALLLAMRRPRGPLMVALSGGVALFIPLTVDFGRYNSDVFRFLFLAAACSAACAGSLAAVPLEWLKRRPLPRRAATLALVALTWHFGSLTISRFRDIVADALLLPQQYPWSVRAWAIRRGNGPSLPADLEVAGAIREQPGVPRLLPTWRDSRYARRSAVLASLGECVPLGFSLRPAVMAQESNLWPSSLVSDAFRATGDPGLLSGLGATLVDINPRTMAGDATKRLLADPRASVVASFEMTDGIRQLVRIENRPPAPPPGSAALVRFISVPEPLWPGEVAAATIGISFPASTSTPPSTSVRVGYRLLSNGSPVNPLDELEQDVALERQSSGIWTGTLTFAAPSSPGGYEIRLNQRFTEGTRDLGLARDVRPPRANVRQP